MFDPRGPRRHPGMTDDDSDDADIIRAIRGLDDIPPAAPGWQARVYARWLAQHRRRRRQRAIGLAAALVAVAALVAILYTSV